MNKAENIYWADASSTRSSSRRSRSMADRRISDKADRRTAPRWVSFFIVASIFVMICISINFRAFSDVRSESDQNEQLASQVQNLMDENLALQEEIHMLKTDPQAIEREARRIGIRIQTEKVPVPAN